ncbi:hypothetical protein [Shahe isopoda virus 2]|uniref:hypothetical protein n=1 Tax=Shahe isopoda virus 2 TaxID=1923422 RepID=UPI000909E694|nr:hypothetical protein [Shahe isopoda virus 2]APG77362.1 hypothetical protein [Shahe isopoda virus 2]APG77407.1 hypothetical protein [Shahe isopoda virus 2]
MDSNLHSPARPVQHEDTAPQGNGEGGDVTRRDTRPNPWSNRSFKRAYRQNASKRGVGRAANLAAIYVRCWERLHPAVAHAGGIDTILAMLAERVSLKVAARGISLILAVCTAGVAIHNRRSPLVIALAVTAAATALIGEFGSGLTVAQIGLFMSHLFKGETQKERAGDDKTWLNMIVKKPKKGWDTRSDASGTTDDASSSSDDDETPELSSSSDSEEDDGKAPHKDADKKTNIDYDDDLSKVPRAQRRVNIAINAARQAATRRVRSKALTPEEAKEEMKFIASTEIPDHIVNGPLFIAKIMLNHAYVLCLKEAIPIYHDAEKAPEEKFRAFKEEPEAKIMALRSWYAHIDSAAEAHAGFTSKSVQENISKIINVGITGLSLLTLATMKFGGFGIDDITKLISQKNVLTAEYTTIKELAYGVARDWFGVELSPAYSFTEQMKKFTDEANELLVLSMQHYYEEDNMAKVTKWLGAVDAFVQSARSIKDVNQSPVYTLLMASYAKIKDCLDLARRNMAMQGHRQEPVVLHLAGDPGVGKTWMSTYVREYVSQELGISSAPYNVNLAATGGFFPPYCGEKWCVVDEYLGSVDDKMVTHLNGICSTAPYKIEGASIPEKNQWVNFDFVILMSNVFRINLPMLTPPAEKAHYSRLKTISVRFPGQNREDPRGMEGRQPDCSHLRLDHVEFAEVGGVYTLHAATPLSMGDLVDDLMRKYRENKAAYERRKRTTIGRVAPPTHRIVRADDMLAEPHAVNTMPFTVHFAGEPGAGKTYASGQCLTAVFADLYNLPVVRVSEEDFTTGKRHKDPAIYYLDDVISESNMRYYMTWFDRLDSRSIVWISSNIVVDKRRSLSWTVVPYVPIGVPTPTSKFVVQVRTGTHQGFLRRIGLSGKVGSIDCECSDIPESDSHGIFFKFERAGVRRKITMYRDGSEFPVKDVKELQEYIAVARAQHMLDSNEICFVYDQPLSGKPMDITLHAPSISELRDIVTDPVKLAAKFMSNDPNYSISGAVFNVGKYARDISAWVYDGELITREDFANCAKFYTANARSAGLRVNVSVAGGSCLAEYVDGVMNLVGTTVDHYVADTSGYTVGETEMLEVRFSDDYTICYDTDRWLALIGGNSTDEVQIHSPARIAMAIQRLKQLSSAAQDPLIHAKRRHLNTKLGEIEDDHVNYFATGIIKLFNSHPLLLLLGTALTVGGVAYALASMFAVEHRSPRDILEDIEDEIDVEKKAMTAEQKHMARACVKELTKRDPDFVQKMENAFPQIYWEMYYGLDGTVVHGHSRKAPGAKTKRPDDYDGNLEGLARHSRKNATNDLERRDIIVDVEQFSSLGGSCYDYISRCRTENRVPKYSDYRTSRPAAHSTSQIDHGKDLPIHHIVESIERASVIVSRPIPGGGCTKLFGLAVAGNTILTVAHIAAEEGEAVEVECDVGAYTITYAAVVRKISRPYELCTIEVTDTAWEARKDITRFFLQTSDDRPNRGFAFRPGTRGRVAQLISTPVRPLENLQFTCKAGDIDIDYRGHSYTSSLASLSGPLGLGPGDCGTPFICDDAFRQHNVIAGIYIGRIMNSAYYVAINDVILREMMTFAHSISDDLEIQRKELLLDRVVNIDVETAHILSNRNPRFDFSADLVGIGGIIGHTIGNHATERPGESPCRMNTDLDPIIAPTDKVPVPTRLEQVEDPSQLVPIPAGSLKGTKNLIYANARGQFHAKTSVGMEHYDHVRPFVANRLPLECKQFRRKTLQEVLNGGTIDDPYRSVRGTIDVSTSAGLFYEIRFGMQDKRRFFRGTTINGEFVPDRPLVINTAGEEGACLMRRLKYITEAAKRGETLGVLAKTFQKRELVAAAKARIGKVRTCESMDFALNLWLSCMLSDFFEIRQHHRYGQHMVIGANFRQEGTWMKRHLQEYNKEEVIAVDVPAWDRNTHADLISSAIKLAFDVARDSPNFTGKDTIENEMKAMMGYYNRPISVLGDAAYWVDGRMSSGMMFTAQFNTDGHLLMRMAGANKLYEEIRGEKMPWDIYTHYCREFLYGDDSISSVKPEGYWLLGPQQQQRIYQMNGYEPTNDRKDGPPCVAPYDEASFCSRYMFDDGMFTYMALKKSTICSFLHWSANLDPEFIEANCRVALEESIPWGRDFFHEVKRGVITLACRYALKCHIYSYDAGLRYYREGVTNELTGSVETRMLDAVGHAGIDLGAKPKEAINHSSTPSFLDPIMSWKNEIAFRSRFTKEIDRCGNALLQMVCDQRRKIEEMKKIASLNYYTIPDAAGVLANLSVAETLAHEIIVEGMSMDEAEPPQPKIVLSDHEAELIMRMRRMDLTNEDPMEVMRRPTAHSSITLPTDGIAPMAEGAQGVEVPSEGPMVLHNFMVPTTGQPTDMVIMAGSQLSSLEIAQKIFIDTSNTAKSISTQASRAVILETFPYLDSSKWSSYMKDNARLNEIAAGTIDYQIEMHGPAINGGAVGFIWLPYTPTTTTIDLTRVGQYPRLMMPVGGSRQCDISIADSKLRPAIREMSEFLSGVYDKKTTPCIVMYLEMEVNNGYNPGTGIQIQAKYVVRSRFGVDWYMSRGVAGGAESGGLVGRTLAELTGTIGLRLKSGSTLAFPNQEKTPRPDAFVSGIQVRGSEFHNDNTVNIQACELAATSYGNNNRTDAKFVYLLVRRVTTGRDAPAGSAGNSLYYENLEVVRLSPQEHSEVTYTLPAEQGIPLTTVALTTQDHGQQTVTMKLMRIDCTSSEGLQYTTFWYFAGYSSEWVVTAVSDLYVTATAVDAVMRAFLSSSIVYTRNCSQIGVSVIPPYVVAEVDDVAYPARGATFIPAKTIMSERLLTIIGNQKYAKFTSPTSGLQFFNLIAYRGQLFTNSSPHLVSTGTIDEWVVSAMGDFSFTSTIDVNLLPTERYNVDAARNETVVIAPPLREYKNMVHDAKAQGFILRRRDYERILRRAAELDDMDPEEVVERYLNPTATRDLVATIKELLTMTDEDEVVRMIANLMVEGAVAHAMSPYAAAAVAGVEGVASGLGGFFAAKRQQKYWMERAAVTADYQMKFMKAKSEEQRNLIREQVALKQSAAVAQANIGINNKVIGSQPGKTTTGTTMDKNATTQTGYRRVNPAIGGLTEDFVDPHAPVFKTAAPVQNTVSSSLPSTPRGSLVSAGPHSDYGNVQVHSQPSTGDESDVGFTATNSTSSRAPTDSASAQSRRSSSASHGSSMSEYSTTSRPGSNGNGYSRATTVPVASLKQAPPASSQAGKKASPPTAQAVNQTTVDSITEAKVANQRPHPEEVASTNASTRERRAANAANVQRWNQQDSEVEEYNDPEYEALLVK